MSAALLHDRLAVTAMFFALAMGLWGLVLAARGRATDGNYVGALLVGEGLLLVQGALGGWLLLARGLSPERGIHLLYGVLSLLVWPFLLTTMRREASPHQAALAGFGSLFLFGLLWRAVTTAGP